MLLRKVSNSETDQAEKADELLPVMLEPLPGHSDQEVVAWLTREGARDVMVLAPGFISALMRRAVLKAAEVIAYVHIKPRKQAH